MPTWQIEKLHEIAVLNSKSNAKKECLMDPASFWQTTAQSQIFHPISWFFQTQTKQLLRDDIEPREHISDSSLPLTKDSAGVRIQDRIEDKTPHA